MILYRGCPLIYLTNVSFFYRSLQNYISVGVTELFFQIEIVIRPLLQNLKDPKSKPYGSNSKTLKICYPSSKCFYRMFNNLAGSNNYRKVNRFTLQIKLPFLFFQPLLHYGMELVIWYDRSLPKRWWYIYS